jgi:hypothetical protein
MMGIITKIRIYGERNITAPTIRKENPKIKYIRVE